MKAEQLFSWELKHEHKHVDKELMFVVFCCEVNFELTEKYTLE